MPEKPRRKQTKIDAENKHARLNNFVQGRFTINDNPIIAVRSVISSEDIIRAGQPQPPERISRSQRQEREFDSGAAGAAAYGIINLIGP